MKRKTKSIGKRPFSLRALAVVLAFSMMFTSSGFQVLAEEAGTEGQNQTETGAGGSAAEEEAARQAAEEEAARQAAADAAAAQQAADEEAARAQQEAAARQAAEEEAARQAAADEAAKQAAADAEAARAQQEASASNGSGNTENTENSKKEDTTEAGSEEKNPVVAGRLVLKVDSASVQNAGEPARIAVEYGLGSECELSSVDVRLYIWNSTVQLPQFGTGSSYTDPGSGRTFTLGTDSDGDTYIGYSLKPGESFRQEFLFADSGVTPGSSATFDVAVGAIGEIPTDNEIQSAHGQVTYALPAEETEAPETEAEEVTEAPETEAEEATESAETETEAEEVTEAPETEATETEEVTESAETETETEEVTEAPETETEEVTESAETETETEEVTEAPETETETELETETETETETELVYGTEFHYEDSSVSVTASASEKAKLPKEAVLKADLMSADSAAYQEVVALVESQLGSAGEGQEADYVFYDVYFVFDGERIEPAEGLVNVSINFKTPVLEQPDKEIEEVTVVHIEEGTDTVQNVTGNVDMTAQGGVSSVDFSTSSFSPVGVRTLSGAVVRGVAGTNLSDFIDSVTIITSDGSGFDPANATANNGWITLEMAFSETPGGMQFAPGIDLNYDMTNDGTIPITGFSAVSGDIKDSNGLKGADGNIISYGTYHISSNGMVTIIFNENVNEYYNLAGKLTFAAQFDKDKIEDKDEITIMFPGETTGKDLYFKDGAAVVGKKTAASYDAARGGFEFTITVKADEAGQNIVLTDKLGDNLVFDKDSLAISPSIQYQLSEVTNTSFKLSINSLEKNTEYQITYFAKLKDGAAASYNGAVGGLTNRVGMSVNGADEVTFDGPASYTHVWVMKSNTGLNENGTIDWVLTANPSADQPMKGVTVSDTLKTDGMDYDTSSPIHVVKKDKNGISTSYDLPWSDVTMSSDGKSWSYTISGDDECMYSYQFTYSTTLESSEGGRTYTNTGKVGNFSADSSVTLTEEEIGTGSGTGTGVVKEYEKIITDPTTGDKYAHWTSTITLPAGQNNNVYYIDELYGSQEFVTPMTVNAGDGSYSDITVEGISTTPTLASSTTKLFRLDFGSLKLQQKTEIKISYYSKVTQDGTVRNIGRVSNSGKTVSTSTSTNTYDYDFKKFGSYNSTTKELTWTIVLQDGQPLGAEADIVVTDIFSDNQEYVEDSATLNGLPISGTCDGNQVTFTIPKAYFELLTGRVELTYKTTLKNTDGLHDKISTTNKASISRGDKVLGTAEAVYEIAGNVLSKELITRPSTDNGYIASYRVNINETGAALLPADAVDKEFVIQDSIAANMEFIVASLELKQDGAVMVNTAYTAEFNDKTLTITIPDGDGHKYTLSYDVSVRKLTSSPEETVPYQNNVSFSVNGKQYVDFVRDEITVTQSASGGAGGTKLYFTLTKYDRNGNTALDGVSYKFYDVGSEAEDNLSAWTLIGTGTTNASGKIIIGQSSETGTHVIDVPGGLIVGHKYALVETQTKAGYILDETPYIFNFDETILNTQNKDFFNDQKTRVTATKVWSDNNNAYGFRPSSITFMLFENDTATNDSKTLTVNDDGTTTPASAVWDNLPKYDKQNNSIHYTVKETSSHDGYTAFVSREANLEGTEYIYTVKNTYTPETVTKAVTKKWADSNNNDGKRPETITLNLQYKIGENGTFANVDAAFIAAYAVSGKTIQYHITNSSGNYWSDSTNGTVELTGGMSAETWGCQWQNLPEYIQGEKVIYEVQETVSSLPEGYTADTNGYAGTDNTIINNYTPDITSKTVKKYWSAPVNVDDDGNRPTEVNVQLKQTYNNITNNYGDEVALNARNNWTKTWEKLPKYVRVDGTSYPAVYTVAETAVPQYTTTYYNTADASGDAVDASVATGDSISIKNVYTPEKISVKAVKSWIDNNNKDGFRPVSIVLTLQKSLDDNTWTDVGSKTLSSSDQWAPVTWEELLKYENNKAVKYQVIEKDVPDHYSVSYDVTVFEAKDVPTGATKQIAVTNTHGAKAALQFTAHKILAGNRRKTLQAGEFDFIVTNASGTTIASGTNAADGSVTFNPELEFTSVTEQGKPIVYTISETSGSDSSIDYSAESYTVKVTVTMDEAGQLTATPEITKGNTSVTGFEKVTFTNNYKASGSTVINGTKTLTGKALTAGEFSFGLYETAEATAPIAGCTGSVSADGSFSIQTPVYTQADLGADGAGTKTYYLKEIADSGKTEIYDYDTAVYKVNISIVDAGNGVLTVTPEITDLEGEETAAAFTNNYKASGRLVLNASKSVTGRPDVPSEFQFELYDLGTEEPEIYTANMLRETVTNNGASISFTPIEYKVSDVGSTHYYLVKEKRGSNGAYTYCTDVYKVKAVVSLGTTPGSIQVETVYYKGSAASGNETESISFENEYQAEGSITLTGQKNLNGKELAEGQFEFKLYEVINKGQQNESENLIGASVTNDAAGGITFPMIKYTQAQIGTHYYRIRETNKEIHGYTYAAPVDITVTVSATGTDELSCVADKDGIGTNGIIFNNTYRAAAEVDLKAEKVLTGRTLEAGQFSFSLTRIEIGDYDEGNPDQSSKSNSSPDLDGKGKVTFDTLNYDQYDIGKTYTYEIREEIPDPKASGYAYDDAVYTVTVKITDPNGNGVLVPVVIYTKGTDEYRGVPLFTNEYKASGETTISGTKKLTGKSLEDGEFTFVLCDANGVSMKNDQEEEITAKNNKDGEFSFDEIFYDQDDVGDHVYKVIEKDDGKDGYEYDETVFTVTVHVADKGDGTLTVTQSIRSDHGDASAVVFHNVYEAAGAANIAAFKDLQGKVLTNQQFSFELTKLVNGSETPVETKKNDASGKVSFATLSYDQTELGDHVYFIREVSDNLDGYEYSTEVYRVTVTVEDKEYNGNLSTSIKYEKQKVEEEQITYEKTDAAEVVFTNQYTASAGFTISGTKKLTGNRVLDEDNQFQFKLMDQDWNPIKDAEGDDIVVFNEATDLDEAVFEFPELTYDQDDVKDAEGAVKEFVYYVEEVKPAEENEYTYSDFCYRVTVGVQDTGKGS
ncbi:MAG: FctA domain-containing protein, partial [Lachnospiraceae bacterium]|nr:FctA domain-containing protein [Lachnospiraceae bacterium]